MMDSVVKGTGEDPNNGRYHLLLIRQEKMSTIKPLFLVMAMKNVNRVVLLQIKTSNNDIQWTGSGL